MKKEADKKAGAARKELAGTKSVASKMEELNKSLHTPTPTRFESVVATQTGRDETDIYMELIRAKGIKVAKKEEVSEILALKNIRAQMSALKKQEDELREKVMAYASIYPGVIEISQNKPSVKVDWEGVTKILSREFKVPENVVADYAAHYTTTKEGAKVLKIIL